MLITYCILLRNLTQGRLTTKKDDAHSFSFKVSPSEYMVMWQGLPTLGAQPTSCLCSWWQRAGPDADSGRQPLKPHLTGVPGAPPKLAAQVENLCGEEASRLVAPQISSCVFSLPRHCLGAPLTEFQVPHWELHLGEQSSGIKISASWCKITRTGPDI